MKFLVIGGGSMGKRRVRCLLANGIAPDQIRIVDQRQDRRDESKSKHNVDGFDSLATGLRWGPDACLVSLPGERAAEVCTASIEAGKPVFCEVPLGASLAQAEQLKSLAERKGVLLAPGAQQPFHPLIRTCRQWVTGPSFGKLLAFNLEWGQYLPGWHPYEDYRTFYSASQLMGVITLEIVQFYFITDDRIRQLKSLRQHVSPLELDGGDVWHFVGTTSRGAGVTIQFDLIQRPARNMVRFASEAGTIELDFVDNRIRRYSVETRQWESAGIPEGYSYEQCYIDEIGLFLRCARGEGSWHNPASTAVDAMRCIDAMVRSSTQPATAV